MLCRDACSLQFITPLESSGGCETSVNVHMPPGQVLLTLLCGRSGGGASSGFHPFRVRALACRCLQGLACDPAMRSILGTLQVSS